MNEILIKIFVCFLASAGAGIGTGFAGMSAVAVIGPVLVAFLGVSSYEAIGIGLISDVLASAVSAYTYKKSGNLDIKNSLPMMISVLAVTIIGSFVANLLPDGTMSGAMQIAMFIIGLRFLLKPVKTSREQMHAGSAKSKLIKAIIGGAFVGFICGFIGAGGGMMMLFVLTTFLGYQMHMAVGTSVFIMTFTAMTGGISHFAIGGKPDICCLALCAIFTLIWARIAAKIANKADAKVLNRSVGIVMIITSLVILAVNYLG